MREGKAPLQDTWVNRAELGGRGVRSLEGKIS